MDQEIFGGHMSGHTDSIPKYDVHSLNNFQDIRQNHWTLKYRSQCATNILRSNIGSY